MQKEEDEGESPEEPISSNPTKAETAIGDRDPDGLAVHGMGEEGHVSRSTERYRRYELEGDTINKANATRR